MASSSNNNPIPLLPLHNPISPAEREVPARNNEDADAISIHPAIFSDASSSSSASTTSTVNGPLPMWFFNFMALPPAAHIAPPPPSAPANMSPPPAYLAPVAPPPPAYIAPNGQIAPPAYIGPAAPIQAAAPIDEPEIEYTSWELFNLNKKAIYMSGWPVPYFLLMFILGMIALGIYMGVKKDGMSTADTTGLIVWGVASVCLLFWFAW